MQGECEEGLNLQSLLMRVSHLYFTRILKQVEKTGLHPGQLPMIKLLGKWEGLSQREIAGKLHVKPPTVAVSIKRLESAGMIERRADQDDQRRSRIFLTEKGRELAAEMEELIQKNEGVLFQGFSESEICLMRRFLCQVIDNLQSMPLEEDVDAAKKE